MFDFFFVFDVKVFTWVNHLFHPDWLVEVARFFTNLGTLGSMWLWLGLGFLIAGGIKGRRVFWLILAGLLSDVVINERIVKYFISRSRPYNFLNNSGLSFYDTKWLDTSFFSGHAFSAFICAMIISKYYPKASWFVFTLAFLISLSRVYLGAHWPTDVICGALFGVFVGFVINLIDKKFLKKIK